MNSTSARVLNRPKMISLLISACFSQVMAAEIPVLGEVEVKATSESGYVVSSISAGTRTETPVEHIPQSIVTIPRAIIEDQGSKTLSDVLRNVSNVNAIDVRDSNLTGFKIRGFSSGTIVDGVATLGIFQNQESLVGIDQLSVIKGPSGGLYGGSQGMNYSTIGGAVVISTVAPEQTPIRQIGLSAGSYDQKGASFDFNQPLNETLAVRLTGEYSDSNSETDRIYFKRTAILPSIALTPNADTKIVLRLRDVRNETLDYPGLPRASAGSPNVIAGIPRSLFVGANGLPPTTNEMQGANLQWTQRLNENWGFGLTLAHNRLKLDEVGVFPGSVIDAFVGGFFGNQFGLAAQDIYGYRMQQKFDSTVISPSLSGKFNTGEVKHTLTLGVDHEKSQEKSFMKWSDPLSMGMSPLTSFVPVNLANYTAPNWIEPAGNSMFDSAYSRNFTATTTYLQDQIDVGNWHFLGSVRYNQIDMRNTDTLTGALTTASTSKATPRVGAVYEFTPQISAFVGYGEAVKTPSLTTFAAGVTPKLEEVTQQEIGFRLKELSGISATIAFFDLTRKNVATSNGISNYLADQGSKGIDIDLRWRVSNNWQWLLAYTSQKAEYTGTQFNQVAGFVGKQVFNVPKESARLATRYDIRTGSLAGVGLGLGVTHHAKLPGDGANSFFTPAATLWDSQISYQIKSARFGLNVNNLLDKKYLVPSAYFGGGLVLPAMPRTITATANFSF